jgi:hypothetical protein
VQSQIQRCYLEMDRFWIEEISRATKALEKRRVDPNDLKRWKDFHAGLRQAIEFGKVYPLVPLLMYSRLTKMHRSGRINTR